MSAWKSIRFAEIGEAIRGVSYTPSDLREERSVTAVTLLRSNNIKGGRINYRDTQYVSKVVVRENQLLKPQDIAICMSNGNRALVGKAGKFEGRSDSLEYTVGAFCAIFRPNQSFDPDFVRHLFGSEAYQKHLDVILAGSAINNLKGSDIKEIDADCPTSKPEQTKIAEILSTVDRAIEQTEALIAKQQRLKTGLMQDLLTRGIDEHGNLRSEQTHEFKDSPLGRIPVEWEVKKLGNLLSSINQGWSPDCESDPAAQGEWGVLRTTAVVWEGYQDYENKGLPSNLAPRPHLEIQAGDLLMTRAGPNSRVGVIAYVYGTRSKLMLSDKIYRLVPTKEADGRFLCYALSSSGSQRHLSNLKTGMAESQTNISQEIVKALMTVCPPSAEQSLIADRLDHISSESNKSTTVLAKLRSLKIALMQDLLTGRKRVSELLPPE